jgi:hypothetical protein
MSSSIIDSKIIKVHRGAGSRIKLAPKYLRRGTTTKKPRSSERNKSYTNKYHAQVKGLASFVADVEGFKKNVISAENDSVRSLSRCV